MKLKNRLSEMKSLNWLREDQKLDTHIPYHLIFNKETKVNQ